MIFDLKVDYDSHKWKSVVLAYERTYMILSSAGHHVSNVRVFRTRHGYHIYMEFDYNNNWFNRDIVNLIECLFESDLKKQTNQFVEGNDILFVKKWNSGIEVYQKSKSVELRKLFTRVDNLGLVYRVYQHQFLKPIDRLMRIKGLLSGRGEQFVSLGQKSRGKTAKDYDTTNSGHRRKIDSRGSEISKGTQQKSKKS